MTRRRPDIADGAGQLLQAVLVDPLVNDVNSLAAGNRDAGRRTIPYIFVAPPTPDAVGRLAADTFNEHYRGARALVRSRDVTLLGRACSGGATPDHGELLSYLFFAPEFTRALADLGRADAQRWLAERHDEGLWQTDDAAAVAQSPSAARASASAMPSMRTSLSRDRSPRTIVTRVRGTPARLAISLHSARFARPSTGAAATLTAHHAVALVDDRIALGAGLQANREVGVGQLRR